MELFISDEFRRQTQSLEQFDYARDCRHNTTGNGMNMRSAGFQNSKLSSYFDICVKVKITPSPRIMHIFCYGQLIILGISKYFIPNSI